MKIRYDETLGIFEAHLSIPDVNTMTVILHDASDLNYQALKQLGLNAAEMHSLFSLNLELLTLRLRYPNLLPNRREPLEN